MTLLDPTTRPWPTRSPHLPAGRTRLLARRRRADLLELAAAGIMVTTIALFLRDGGGQALSGAAPAARWVALGRLTGLLGTALLLLQLLLAARLPWLDRTYGHDRALLAHRLLARVSLPLLVTHAGVIVVGYAAVDRLTGWPGWLREGIRMLRGQVPDMLTAFIALGIILLVAVTSVAAARHRLRHETWHVVHLLAYLGVVLAVPHQLSSGSDLAGRPAARAWWLALYLSTAGAVVAHRVLLPIWRNLRHRVVVVAVVAEGPGVVSVTMSGHHLHRLPARAGQFLYWRFLTPGLLAAHPWSLSAAPDGRTLRITVRDLGDHSRRVARLRPGTRVWIEGPYGAFTTELRTRRPVLLVAAGIGITPVRALAEELVGDGLTGRGQISLLYRAAAGRLVLEDELAALARERGLRLALLPGAAAPGSWLPHRLTRGADDAAVLQHLVPGLRDHDVYLCGPPDWMALVRASLRRAGVPASQLHDERFSW